MTLVELAIAASILMVVTVLAAGRLIREVDDAAAQATGTYLLAVKGALDGYLTRHYDALSDGQAVEGFAAPLAPTLPELRLAGMLSPAFPERTPFNQEVAVRIERRNCPGSGCRLDALAFGTTPVRTAGSIEANSDLVAQVVMASGGHGGASYLDAPAVLRGPAFSTGNPLGATAGIVAVLSNLDTTPFQQFVRMRDPRNPDLQGAFDVRGLATLHGGVSSTTGLFSAADGSTVSIDPATGVTASKRVRAEAGLATARGSLFDSGDADPTIRASGDRMALATSAGQALTLAGRDLVGQAGVSAERLGVREIALANTACAAKLSSIAGGNAEFARSAAGGLLVCADGIWRELAAMASRGAACQPNGAFATDAGGLGGLVCRLGVWVAADDLFSSYVMVGSRLVADGEVVSKPGCGPLGTTSGTPLIYLLPQAESSRAGAFTRRAEDLGDAWRIRLLDYDGAPSGGPARALAQMYCKY